MDFWMAIGPFEKSMSIKLGTQYHVDKGLHARLLIGQLIKALQPAVRRFGPKVRHEAGMEIRQVSSKTMSSSSWTASYRGAGASRGFQLMSCSVLRSGSHIFFKRNQQRIMHDDFYNHMTSSQCCVSTVRSPKNSHFPRLHGDFVDVSLKAGTGDPTPYSVS